MFSISATHMFVICSRNVTLIVVGAEVAICRSYPVVRYVADDVTMKSVLSGVP